MDTREKYHPLVRNNTRETFAVEEEGFGEGEEWGEKVESVEDHAEKNSSTENRLKPPPNATLSIPDLASLRARIHTIRAVSSALVFIVLRQQLHTIQGVLSISDTQDVPTEHMVRWGSRLEEETIVHVKGMVQRPKDGEVHSTSVHMVELRIVELHVVSGVAEPVPFSVYEADLSAAAKEVDDDDELKSFIPDRSRLASRIIHLRSASAQSIFRFQSTVSMTFRSHLDGTGLDFVLSLKDIFPSSSISIPGGFMEIHTPKLQGGASVFKLKYFSRLAFLAQSPQLPKQEYLDTFRWGAPPPPRQRWDRAGETGDVDSGSERYPTDEYVPQGPKESDGAPERTRGRKAPGGGYTGNLPTNTHQVYLSSEGWVTDTDTSGGVVGFVSLLPGSQQQTVPKRTLPTVPVLIANYGDAANTSWLDDRYLVWRDVSTGAAIGFVPSSSGSTIIVGDPLCDKSQYPSVINRFLQWLKHGEQHRSDEDHKDHHNNNNSSSNTPSARASSWLSFTCVAESRVELSSKVPAALQEKEVARKVRKAEAEGVEVRRWMGREGFFVGQGNKGGGGGEEVNEYDISDGIHIEEDLDPNTTASNSKSMPLGLRHTIDARIREWRDARAAKGGQVRLTEVEVWRDYVHREYFVALAPRRMRGEGGKDGEGDGEGEGEKEVKGNEEEKKEKGDKKKKGEEREPELIPVALVVLHQLSPIHGFQVKYALDFPSTERWRTGSTSGVRVKVRFIPSPLLLLSSLPLPPSFHLFPSPPFLPSLPPLLLSQILSHAYEAISERMSLRSKGDFRKKMGAEEEDVYICYPRGGLGGRGAKAVLDFCVAES
ncbi:hypothetical protein EV359DRAFT_79728 [Lentinula novae-zelandiae]|nr:hypothetical protein EV359DRAFT_79728 [Lentinula novae-zelandiae]